MAIYCEEGSSAEKAVLNGNKTVVYYDLKSKSVYNKGDSSYKRTKSYNDCRTYFL